MATALHCGCVRRMRDAHVLVHRQRATKVTFHKAVQERRLLILPGIHYFDAHRLQPELLAALEAGDGPRTKLQNGPDRAQDTVQDTYSDDDTTTTDLDKMQAVCWMIYHGVLRRPILLMTPQKPKLQAQQITWRR